MTIREERRAAPGWRHWIGRGALLVVFAASAYALSLAATAPAGVIDRLIERPAQVEALGGTVWNGEARLTGAHRVTWRIDPRGSLSARALRFDVTASGPEMRLTALADLSPNAVILRDVSGRAGWGTVRAFAPGVALDCTPVAALDLRAVAVARDRLGMDGTIRTTDGTCRPPSGEAVPVPALRARGTMAGMESRLVLTRADDPEPLAEAVIEGAAWLRATVLPAGARLVPGLPAAAPTVLEMELPRLVP